MTTIITQKEIRNNTHKRETEEEKLNDAKQTNLRA